MADNQKAQQGGGEKMPPLTALIKKDFPKLYLDSHAQHGDETVSIKRAGMLELFLFLKDDPRCKFDMMIDLTAVDYLPRSPRFEMVYHFKSSPLHHRLRVKIPLEESACQVDSIEPLWVAADWYERECWEMYGIDFQGHPNLKFLLRYEGFQGHPLRKDYDKLLMQPLVPMRPVAERHDYGEVFQYVQEPPPSVPEQEPS
ncbi:MAG: NADH-quinone oxidoreductase subunit C [SAR324 cluster bacterium]|nr:NADH-quinone oxidoreductase subunit C [SAR324 cluster bacterium]